MTLDYTPQVQMKGNTVVEAFVNVSCRVTEYAVHIFYDSWNFSFQPVLFYHILSSICSNISIIRKKTFPWISVCLTRNLLELAELYVFIRIIIHVNYCILGCTILINSSNLKDAPEVLISEGRVTQYGHILICSSLARSNGLEHLIMLTFYISKINKTKVTSNSESKQLWNY